LTFELLLFRLRELLREKVKNGHLTERGMARSTGVSQPHLHNILKGIRSLPPDLADQLLALAGFNLPDLLGISGGSAGPASPAPSANEAEKSTEMEAFIEGSENTPAHLPAFQLLGDSSMEPRFQGGDVVYYQRNVHARSELTAQAVYLVNHNHRVLVRYLRMGGQRLYLVSEDTLRDPVHWDYVSLSDRHILEVVRGRIVWICRKVETVETGSSQETR
jgi:hypothetical protein